MPHELLRVHSRLFIAWEFPRYGETRAGETPAERAGKMPAVRKFPFRNWRACVRECTHVDNPPLIVIQISSPRRKAAPKARKMTSDNDWQSIVFARSENVVRRDVGGETVLVPVAGDGVADLEYLYRMNPVGAAVWDALDGHTAVGELVDRVMSSFDASGPDSGGKTRKEVEEDVRSFLVELDEARLVRRKS